MELKFHFPAKQVPGGRRPVKEDIGESVVQWVRDILKIFSIDDFYTWHQAETVGDMRLRCEDFQQPDEIRSITMQRKG